jgi:hypothetical protein
MPISQGSPGTAVLDLCLCDLDERSCPAPHGDRLRRSSMSNCPRHRTQRSTVVAGHPGHRQRAAAGLTHRGRPPPVTIGGFRGVCPHSSQLRRTQVSVLSAYGRRLTVRSNNRRLSRFALRPSHVRASYLDAARRPDQSTSPRLRRSRETRAEGAHTERVSRLRGSRTRSCVQGSGPHRWRGSATLICGRHPVGRPPTEATPGSRYRVPPNPGRGSSRAITGLPALARFAPRPLFLDLADQVSTHLREGMIKVALVGGCHEVRPSR